MALTNEKLIDLYRKMLLARVMEAKHLQLLAEGRFQLMSHPRTGQEAISIGVTGPLRKENILFGTHRGVGEYIGKGMSSRNIFLEYMGRKAGHCKGKRTIQLGDRRVNIPGLVSNLGSDFSIAVGTALASKM